MNNMPLRPVIPALNYVLPFFLASCFLWVSFLVLYLANLTQNPAGFFVDEANAVNNAYAIFTTGQDELSKPYPFIFNKLSDSKQPVFIYMLLPFVAVLGPTELCVRLLSALSILLAAFVHMYIAIKLTRSFPAGIVAALVVLLLPWAIHFGRLGFEVSTTFLFTSSWLATLVVRRPTLITYILSAVLFFLAFFSYTSTQFPLLFAGLAAIAFNGKNILHEFKKSSLFLRIIFVVCILALIFIGSRIFTNPSYFTRLAKVNNPAPAAELLKRYIKHFDMYYLITQGDASYPQQYIKRHSLWDIGIIGPFFILPCILGAIRGFFFLPKSIVIIVWILLLTAPLGSVISSHTPHAIRSAAMVIPLVLFIYLGIHYLFLKLKYTYITFGFLSLFFSATLVFHVQKLITTPLHTSGYYGFQYGFLESCNSMASFSPEKGYVTHRFNSAESLLSFYQKTNRCKGVAIATNPITIKEDAFYALRLEDIEEAQKLYNSYTFMVNKVIQLPNGSAELYVGQFKKTF